MGVWTTQRAKNHEGILPEQPRYTSLIRQVETIFHSRKRRLCKHTPAVSAISPVVLQVKADNVGR